MKPIFLSLLLASALCTATAQQTDDATTYTLDNGKVLHFATEEAKAKFLAARQRAAAPSPVPISPLSPATASGDAPLIALDVSSLNAGSTFTINWMTDYGSYDYTGRTSKALDLHIRNLSARSGKVTLQWIFTARVPMHPGRFVFDVGSRDWDLEAGQDAHLGVQSLELKKQVVIYAALGQSSYEGADMEGWLVVVRSDNKIIKSLGSTPTLESLAGTAELEEMIADYEKTQRKDVHTARR